MEHLQTKMNKQMEIKMGVEAMRHFRTELSVYAQELFHSQLFTMNKTVNQLPSKPECGRSECLPWNHEAAQLYRSGVLSYGLKTRVKGCSCTLGRLPGR